MDSRFSLNKENNTCSIFPGVLLKHPNGLNLTYDECPERFDNSTAKAIRYCCYLIMDNHIQTSYLKKTQDWLRYNSSSVLVIPAVLFNLLSLVVLIRFQKQRGSTKTSTTFYMECLCIFDMLTILSKFLNEVIVVRNGLREDPIVINSFICKALSFSESSCAICSIYLLIAMSIDKLICVLAPLKVGQLLTPTKAKIIFSFIFVFSVCISSYNLFDKIVYEFEVIKEDSHDQPPRATTPSPPTANDTLTTNQTYLQALAQYFNSNGSTGHGTGSGQKINNYDCASSWTAERINDLTLIDNIIRVFLPVILLCVCNFWIALALAKARKNTEALFQDNSSSSRNDENTLAHMGRHHIKPKMGVKEKMRKMLRLDRLTRTGGGKKNSAANGSNNDDAMRKSSAYDYTYNENESDDENEFDDETTNCGSKSSQMEVASVSARPTRSSIANLEATGMVHTHKKSIAHIRGRNSTQHISLMLFAVSIELPSF